MPPNSDLLRQRCCRPPVPRQYLALQHQTFLHGTSLHARPSADWRATDSSGTICRQYHRHSDQGAQPFGIPVLAFPPQTSHPWPECHIWVRRRNCPSWVRRSTSILYPSFSLFSFIRASILYPSFTLLSLFSPSFAHPQGHFFSTYNHNHLRAHVYLISPVPTLVWYRGGVLERGDHDTITRVHVTRNPTASYARALPFSLSSSVLQ